MIYFEPWYERSKEMPVETSSFWREVKVTYLSYLVVGATALPFAIVYAFLSIKGLVTPAWMAVLAVGAVASAWIILKWAPWQRAAGSGESSFASRPARVHR
jgi:protein-S-isoprenylcysteine O-methyltransferase Ste14